MMQATLIILSIPLAHEPDGSGIYGGIFHYGMIMALMGSALLAFIYFWSKKRLDFDEEPKMQMMQDDGKEDIHGS